MSSCYHHEIEYSEGNVLYITLRTLGVVFFKSVWLLFHKMTTREVTNLEYVTNWPWFSNLSWSDEYCSNHAVKNNYLQFAFVLNFSSRIKAYWLSKSQNLDSDLSLSSFLLFFYEQLTDSKQSIADPPAYRRCVSIKSDPLNVDGTDHIFI